MAVDHRQTAIVVLLAHEPAGVLAERAHLVAKRVGVPDELAFVEHVVHALHDLVAHLHAYAYVHRPGGMLDAVHGAQALEPISSATTRSNDRAVGKDVELLAVTAHPHAAADGPHVAHALHDHVQALGLEQQLDAGGAQVVLDATVDLLRLLGAQVPDGAIHQLDTRLNGATANLFHLVRIAHAFHMLVGSEVKIDAIDLLNGGLSEIGADKVGQVAAHLVRERQLAVGESAGARKARGDAARVAPHAMTYLGLGAAAAFDGQTLLHNDDIRRRACGKHAQRREDARRPRAHDDDVGITRIHAAHTVNVSALIAHANSDFSQSEKPRRKCDSSQSRAAVPTRKKARRRSVTPSYSKTTRDYSKVEKNECKAFVYYPSLMSISHAVAGPVPLPMALAALTGT